jgi:ubiquitin carboxyl-terminal hydrolase 7
VRASLKPPNLVPLMNSLVGQSPNTPLLVFEEVKPNMVDICRPNLTLRELEISDGDILVFQRTPELRDSPAYGLASVPEYYDYILNRVTVKFRRLDQPRKDAFTLELSKKMLYDHVI